MKKLAAILLSAVLLFNWYGVQPLMNWMNSRADRQMAQKLDEQDYNESSLIEISVATNLPYTNNWTDFERTDGSIEYNGIQYSYVMRKMEDGIMIYKCIPNDDRNKISSARNEFFKQAFDFAKVANSKKQESNKSISVKKTMDDYTNHFFEISIVNTDIKHTAYINANANLASGFYVLPFQPPQV